MLHAKRPKLFVNGPDIVDTAGAGVSSPLAGLDCVSSTNTHKEHKIDEGDIVRVISIRKKYLAPRNDIYIHYQRRLRFFFWACRRTNIRIIIN